MPLSLLRHHWPAVLLAVFVGFLLVLPPLWLKVRDGVGFNDPVNIRISDEFFYFARVRDVIDGYPFSGNPFLWEHKSKLPGQPVFLGEYLTAKIIQALGMPVVAGSVILDFFLPLLAVLLTYACLWAVTCDRWLSLFASALLFLVFFSDDFARAVSPQMNFLFWLSEFLLIYFIACGNLQPKARRFIIALATVNFGLLFYIYTYYWTFYLALFGILGLAALLLKESGLTKALLAVAAGGFLIALPYFGLMSRVMFLPEFSETVRRIGMIDSHFPSGIRIVIPTLVLLVLSGLFIRLRIIAQDRRLLLLVSGTLAAVVSVNQHVITGKNLEFSSHYYMLSVFWFIFFAAYLTAEFLARKFERHHLTRVLVILTTLSIVVYAITDAVPPKFMIARAKLRRYLPLFEWLNANTREDEVVYAHSEISNLVPIYTSNNVFFSPWSRLMLMRNSETLDRFALSAYYEPWDTDTAIRNVLGTQYLNAALHAGQENKIRRLFGLALKPVVVAPVETVVQIEKRVAEVRATGLYEELKRYRVDYVIFDRSRTAAFEPPPGKKLYDQGDYVVYSLR